VKTIYVVEPHSDTAALETDLLQDAGFTVRVVSADAAEAALAVDGVGLLLVTTGPRDGAAASALLARANIARVPVIVTTTGRDTARWSSAAAVLCKPFDFEDLLAEVRAHFAAG
jgi:DNA-binding response OmpR family regulator